MNVIGMLLTGALPPDVYRLASRMRPERVCTPAVAHGWRCFTLDGTAITDKATFLDACARELAFPAYFGKNWDALLDSATDLAWLPAPGYLLLYDAADRFALRHPADYAIARDVLADVVARWRTTATPFTVLIRGRAAATHGLPTLETSARSQFTQSAPKTR